MPRGGESDKAHITAKHSFIHMEANEAKKPKRPRIGQPMGLGEQGHGTENHYENSFSNNAEGAQTPGGERHEGFQQDRPYQPRNN